MRNAEGWPPELSVKLPLTVFPEKLAAGPRIKITSFFALAGELRRQLPPATCAPEISSLAASPDNAEFKVSRGRWPHKRPKDKHVFYIDHKNHDDTCGVFSTAASSSPLLLLPVLPPTATPSPNHPSHAPPKQAKHFPDHAARHASGRPRILQRRKRITMYRKAF